MNSIHPDIGPRLSAPRTQRAWRPARVPVSSLLAGRYELVEVVAEGGVARVWKARDHAAQGLVAAKQLKQEFMLRPHSVKMFDEEARILRRLRHPNLVNGLDQCHPETGERFLILEWVDGFDLNRTNQALAQVGGLAWDEATYVVREAIRGLRAAHESTLGGVPSPILHRDISPENILLTRAGSVKLADFGIALAADRTAYSTEPGALLGKLPYMAPEQFGTGPATPRTDVRAMALVLYEAIAGRRQFVFPTIRQTYDAIMANDLPPLDAVAEAPRCLSNALAAAISPAPADRPESARRFEMQLASMLARYAAPHVEERIREAVDVASDRRSNNVRAAAITLGQT